LWRWSVDDRLIGSEVIRLAEDFLLVERDLDAAECDIAALTERVGALERAFNNRIAALELFLFNAPKPPTPWWIRWLPVPLGVRFAIEAWWRKRHG
jgi:hypothetical protein